MGGGRPSRAKLPPPPPPAPTPETVQLKKAQVGEAERIKRRRRGRAGTILTEPSLGIGDEAKKTLLG